MIDQLSIRNFRSIERSEIQLAPLTILYGPTSSGKSNLLYSLLVLRNFIINSNRTADGFFNLGFMDLGGFEACVYDHNLKNELEIGIHHQIESHSASYNVKLSKTSADITHCFDALKMETKVNLPYAVNQSLPFNHKEDEEEYTINWNGITCSVSPKKPTAETQQKAREKTELINKSTEILKSIDIAPHRRGFFKPNYSPSALSPIPTSEDEVASLIINDQHMPGRISAYCEEIFNRDFRIHTPPGTATAFFQSTDKISKIPVYLVNEGFGVNQVIYMLAKILRTDVTTILIEEPEVHLHPTIIRNFSRALVTIAKDEGKQILLTTHSEQFVISLLTLVSESIIQPGDIRFYLTKKDKKKTSVIEQKVNNTGQIEGGLTSFMESEIEDLQRFLGVK